MAQDLIDKIREQAQARGLDPETAVRIAQAESSLDPSAKAKTSSAQGLFQVVDSTWKEFGGKPGKKADVDENIRVGLNILESNQRSLKNALGREPSATELYAAHFLGATGAKTLLTAAPDTPVSQLLSQRAIKANPSMLKDKNVEQLMGILNTKMGAPAAAVAAAAPTKAQAPMPAAAAGAPKRTAAPAAPVISKGMNLGTGYQAALALAFLGDEEEDSTPLTREQWQERQDQTSAAQMLADYKPKNALQDINWDESALFPAQPVKMAEGGDVDLEKVQSEARQGEAYRQMEQYLRAREAMPDIVAKKLPEPINAQFTAMRMPAGSGRIELHKDPDVLRVIGPSLMAHELAHAAERQMGQQASEESSVFGGKSQFAEAYDKLVGRGPFVSGKKRAEFAQKIAPDWASFNREYRASPTEIGAHGVGAFAPSKNMQDSAPLHVDATAATEFQILLDLAQRNAKNRATGAARIPNFLKQVMGFAEGGEVEPTPEELAAAARPAFVTSRSGIGRKISTKPGEIDSAIVQGISEMPYNLVGSVADVGALALRPFGYTNPTPFLGSEQLKQLATRAGIRQAPPEQPTARAFYELSQLGSSLINPAAPVRAVATAAERVAPIVERAVAAAAPAARSTAAQMLEKVQDVPVGMSIKPVEPIFRHTPSAEAPFVGRLDEFVATLQSPVRKEQFLGQLKGKFREQDIARAEGALQDLPANAKLAPADLLNRLKERYDPANMRTTVLPPKDKSYFSAQDNPYWDKPVGVIHLSSYAEPALLERVKKAESLNPEFSNLRSLEYEATGFPKIAQVAQQDPQAAQKLDEVIRMREQTQEHLRPLIEGRLLMQAHDYPILSSNFNQRQRELRQAYRAAGHRDPYSESMEAAKASIKREAADALVRMYGRVPATVSELQALVANKMGDRYDDWAKQGEILEQGTKKAADDLRTFLLSDPQRFGIEAPYKGKSVHGSLNPPPNAAAFTRFVEQTARDPDRGQLKGIHLLEIQSDLTSELKAGKAPGLKEKEVFPNMAENRRLVQQLGMKNAISAAINRGDQFVTFPGAESAKPKLYESLRDNLKAVAKDLGPGFEIRPFTFTSGRDNKEMQHLGITWGPEAATRVQKQGVPFKDGGMVESDQNDNRKYL